VAQEPRNIVAIAGTTPAESNDPEQSREARDIASAAGIEPA
jgi:hypothetical protein